MTTTPMTSENKEADDAIEYGVEHNQNNIADTYPEGGLQAWMAVLGAWCAMISYMGLLNTLAVLQAWVSEHQLRGTLESTVGWIFSTYSFFLYFCGAQIGPLFDAYDIRLLLVPGLVGMAAAVMCMSFST
ncbi:oxalate formate antiporter, partial [Colletotrichum sojae]